MRYERKINACNTVEAGILRTLVFAGELQAHQGCSTSSLGFGLLTFASTPKSNVQIRAIYLSGSTNGNTASFVQSPCYMPGG